MKFKNIMLSVYNEFILYYVNYASIKLYDFKSIIWKKKEKKIYGESWSYPQRNTRFKFFYY